MTPNRCKTLVGLPRPVPPREEHEPFELRARMVRLQALPRDTRGLMGPTPVHIPPARRVSTHTRLKHPAPAPRDRAFSGKEFAVSAASVFMLGCVLLALMSGCSTRIAGSPHQPEAEADPCTPAPSQCIDQARAASLAYQEPPLAALEARTFCDAMLTTLPLATAKGRFELAESSRRLVNVCYEKGRVPLAEALACSDSLVAADKSAAAAIERYSSVTMPLMAAMTRQEAIEFTRATSVALDGQLPIGRDHECVGGAVEAAP